MNFKATVNQGAIFGAAQGKGRFFIFISIGAVGLVVWMFYKSGSSRIERFLFALLLAGILGNLYDRIEYKYVRDLFFLLPDTRWPGGWSLPLIDYPDASDRLIFPYIFNLADVFICLGALMLLPGLARRRWSNVASRPGILYK